MSAPSPLELPDRFPELRGQLYLGRFEVSTLEQAGPHDVVFGARDRETGEWVLLRLLLPSQAYHDDTWSRFDRRIRAARRVRHPNIVRPRQSGESYDGCLFVVCRRPKGQPMSRWLAGLPQGRVPWSDARLLLLQLASGLQTAHARGVIHGNLRPSNCWIDTTTARPHIDVLGLGTCLGPDVHERVRMDSITTIMIHDVEYVAPEASGGGMGDERSDIYRLGLVAYTMLAGHPPFHGENPFQVAAQHAGAVVPSLGNTVPGVTAAVDGLLRRLLAKKPEDRLGSMDEVMVALGDPAVLETDDSVELPTAPYRTTPPPGAESSPRVVQHQPGRFVAPPQGAYEETQILSIDEVRGGRQRIQAAPCSPAAAAVMPSNSVPARTGRTAAPSAVAPAAAMSSSPGPARTGRTAAPCGPHPTPWRHPAASGERASALPGPGAPPSPGATAWRHPSLAPPVASAARWPQPGHGIAGERGRSAPAAVRSLAAAQPVVGSPVAVPPTFPQPHAVAMAPMPYRPRRSLAAQPWPVLPPPSAFLGRRGPPPRAHASSSTAALPAPTFRLASWLLAWSLLVAACVLAVGVWLHA